MLVSGSWFSLAFDSDVVVCLSVIWCNHSLVAKGTMTIKHFDSFQLRIDSSVRENIIESSEAYKIGKIIKFFNFFSNRYLVMVLFFNMQ